jgi:hypothetical protein
MRGLPPPRAVGSGAIPRGDAAQARVPFPKGGTLVAGHGRAGLALWEAKLRTGEQVWSWERLSQDVFGLAAYWIVGRDGAARDPSTRETRIAESAVDI